MNGKSTLGVFAFFMFVFGIFLMIIAEHVDFVFGVGLLFFLISIVIAILEITWRVAVGADDFFRRHY